MSAASATLTFEQMMALFHETREQQKETDRLLKETAREWRERNVELDWRWEETKQRMARLGDRLGELVAAMVEGGVLRMFGELGYRFDVFHPNYPFGNKELNIYGEVDLFLENGHCALLVEVKTNLSVKDVKDHAERLKKFRAVADAKNDKRRFLAAVSGLVRKNVREFALKQGMFVVQQSGENVEVIPPKGKPKVW